MFRVATSFCRAFQAVLLAVANSALASDVIVCSFYVPLARDGESFYYQWLLRESKLGKFSGKFSNARDPHLRSYEWAGWNLQFLGRLKPKCRHMVALQPNCLPWRCGYMSPSWKSVIYHVWWALIVSKMLSQHDSLQYISFFHSKERFNYPNKIANSCEVEKTKVSPQNVQTLSCTIKRTNYTTEEIYCHNLSDTGWSSHTASWRNVVQSPGSIKGFAWPVKAMVTAKRRRYF